jgi:hypothetical protein
MAVVANEPSPPALNRGLITVSVMLASFLQALDQTIANVALPRMGGELSATQEQVSARHFADSTSRTNGVALLVVRFSWPADTAERCLASVANR